MSRRTLLQKARDWLPRMTQAAGGETITYARGAESITLTAVLGRVATGNDVEGPAKIQYSDGDFFITVADMGAFGEPRIGDTITVTLSGQTVRFEVAEPGTSEPHVRYADPQQKQYLVHTKLKRPRA